MHNIMKTMDILLYHILHIVANVDNDLIACYFSIR